MRLAALVLILEAHVLGRPILPGIQLDAPTAAAVHTIDSSPSGLPKPRHHLCRAHGELVVLQHPSVCSLSLCIPLPA